MRKFKSIVVAYWILVVLGAGGSFFLLTGWSYPITQVSKPLAECKSVHWDQMPDGCVIDIPKIAGGDTEAFKDKSLYRLIYSDLWGSTYNDGWDVSQGSSPGMDIVSSKGTPVYSIGDGTVVQAGYKFGIGNSLTVRYSYNGSYIYASYSHLDETYFNLGDYVKEGQLIGKVGNSGTTFGQYGNHLDFQITTTNQLFYPYSYHDCNVGLVYYDIVNSSLCRTYMKANTMDPLLLLEGGSKASTSDPNSKLGWFQQLAAQHRKDPSTNVETVVKDSAGSINVGNDITNGLPSSDPVVIDTNTKPYSYQVVGLAKSDTVEVRRKFVFFVKVTDVVKNELYNGALAHNVMIRDTKGLLAFDKPVITHVQDGVATITAVGLKSGYTTIAVEIAGKVLGEFGMTVK